MYRTNTCGELRLQDAGKQVTLAGSSYFINFINFFYFLLVFVGIIIVDKEINFIIFFSSFHVFVGLINYINAFAFGIFIFYFK